MRFLTRVVVPALAAVLSLAACSITPAQREAIERAWAERDQERARECAQRGLGYRSGGGCTGGGAP
jgi:hypothetical protein